MLDKLFSVADKYFRFAYCIVNLWKLFSYTLFETSHFIIILYYIDVYRYFPRTNYYMQSILRSCDFTNGLISENPISSYFYIPLVLVSYCFAWKTIGFVLCIRGWTTGKMWKVSRRGNVHWPYSIHSTYFTCFQVYKCIYIDLQFELSIILLNEYIFTYIRTVKRYRIIWNWANKQLICPPYTIKVTEITRQIM